MDGPFGPQSNDHLNDQESAGERTGILQRMKSALVRKPTKSGKSSTEFDRSSILRRSGSRLSTTAMSYTTGSDQVPPMPSEVEVEALFQTIMQDSLSSDKLQELSARLDFEKKWQMVVQSGKLEEFNSNKITTGQLIAKLQSSETALAELDLISTLRIQLTNQPLSWLKEFIQFGGIDVLIQGLEISFELSRIQKTRLVGEWLRATKAFTNNQIGLEAVLNRQDFINALCLHVSHAEEPEYRLIPIHILTVVAYAQPETTLAMIIAGMSYLQHKKEEDYRFDSFLKGLSRDCQQMTSDEVSVEVINRSRSAVVDGIIFINALLENIEDVEVRIHIRNQLFRRPVRAHLEKLRNCKDLAISRQLDAFQVLLENDAEWLMQQWGKSSKIFMSARDLFDVLEESFKGSHEGTAPLAQLFQHLLCIRADASVRIRYVKFLDCTLEALLIAGKGIDPDFCAAPVPYLNVNELDRLLNTKEIDALRQENLRLKFQMASLEDQSKRSTSTSELTIANLSLQVKSLQEQLNSSIQQSQNVITSKAQESELRIVTLQGELEQARIKANELERELLELKKSSKMSVELTSPTMTKISPCELIDFGDSKTDSPTVKKLEISALDSTDLATSSLLVTPTRAKVLAPPPPPPPPPLLPRLAHATPPPPPPPSSSVAAAKVTSSPSLPSPYPTSTKRLKAMQWRKLFPKDINGSLWEEYNSKLFQGKIPFQEIDRLFSIDKEGDVPIASQTTSKSTGPLEIIRNILTVENKMMISILLGKGHHDEIELANALEGMDERKFTPGLCAQLRKCFWDIGKDGTERIKFIANRIDVAELIHGINNILEPLFQALQRIRSSDRLKKIYWLMLYVGNYINQGTTRGNALGFYFDYVTLLKPLKGNEPDSNMLNFLVGLMKKEFPDLLDLLHDLLPIKEASGKKMKDIEELVGRFGEAIATTKTLVESYRLFPVSSSLPQEIDASTDRFMVCTKTYLEDLQSGQEAINKRLKTLDDERQLTLKYLAETSNMSNEAIFAIFNEFLGDIESSRLFLDKKLLAIEKERRCSTSKKVSRVAGILNEKSERRGVVDNILASLRAGEINETVSSA